MRISIGNGQYIESINKDIPSKRRVKIGGGSLKRLHSRETGRNVGGTNNDSRATYINFETNPETGEVFINRSLPRETCTVRHDTPENVKRFTTDLGGSCSTGYIGGKGV